MFNVRSLTRRPGLGGPAVWLAWPILGALAGCSGAGAGSGAPTFEVKGRVLLRNDRPLERGRVVFVPVDVAIPPAAGEIGPDGSFALATRADADGAAAGRYKVRIEPAATATATATRARRPSRPEFPVKYIDEDTSGLVVEVKPEANRLDPFRLK